MNKLVAVVALLVGTGFATASPVDSRPSVTAAGIGKVMYVPDLGHIQVGVAAEGWTVAEAWNKNEEIVKRIFTALKELGVQDKDLRTTNLNVQPRYLHRQNEEPQFLGYTVSYQLTVTVRKLDQVGTVLDRMVDAGANRQMHISFGCSKVDTLLDDARARAVAEARKKANIYVSGTGAKLGEVLSISDLPHAAQPRGLPIDALALAEGKASLPIAAGEQEMSVSVTVTWAIDNRKVEGQ
jgi:uncharacterized protein